MTLKMLLLPYGAREWQLWGAVARKLWFLEVVEGTPDRLTGNLLNPRVQYRQFPEGTVIEATGALSYAMS